MSRSVTIRTPESSPNPSNSWRSHSSSTFQDRFPTKRLALAPGISWVFDFFAAGASCSSALRFLGDSLGDSLADSSVSSESESESESESDSESEPEPDLSEESDSSLSEEESSWDS